MGRCRRDRSAGGPAPAGGAVVTGLSGPGSGTDDQHRAWSVPDDVVGHAAEHPALDAIPAARPDDDHVGGLGLGGLHDRRPGSPSQTRNATVTPMRSALDHERLRSELARGATLVHSWDRPLESGVAGSMTLTTSRSACSARVSSSAWSVAPADAGGQVRREEDAVDRVKNVVGGGGHRRQRAHRIRHMSAGVGSPIIPPRWWHLSRLDKVTSGTKSGAIEPGPGPRAGGRGRTPRRTGRLSAVRSDDALHALDRATRAIAGELDLDRVLQLIVDRVRELVGARYAALGIVGRGGRIERFITSGMSAELRRGSGRCRRATACSERSSATA